MKRNEWSLDWERIYNIWITFICFVVLIAGPAVFLFKTKTTQDALNVQCNAKYSFLQVALARDNLSRQCQIKNQTVTIK